MYAGRKISISFSIFILSTSLCLAQDSTVANSDSLSSPDTSFTKESKSKKSNDEIKLQEFRKAFQKVVNTKNINQIEKVQHDPYLDLGVLVLDETRTKMGRDFYSLFYQNWQAPDSVSNYTITILEQPSPGIGSLVTIKIDYKPVYRARLQPRYAYIEAVSKQAVAQCLQIIERNEKVRQQLSGF